MAISVKAVGALYLNRYTMFPCFQEKDHIPAGINNPNTFNKLPLLKNRHQIRRLIWLMVQWVANYEEWVIDEMSMTYRLKTLQNWNQHFIQPDQVPENWRLL